MTKIIAQRNLMLELSIQLRASKPLTSEQEAYLADAFEKIGNGASADEVFHLKRKQGQSIKDDEIRQGMSFITQVIACSIQPIGHPFFGRGLSLSEAFEGASLLAKKHFSNGNAYDVEYIKKWWYDPRNEHMRSPFRNHLQPDSPYPKITK